MMWDTTVLMTQVFLSAEPIEAEALRLIFAMINNGDIRVMKNGHLI